MLLKSYYFSRLTVIGRSAPALGSRRVAVIENPGNNYSGSSARCLKSD
jgi:hypothetical protein